MTATRPARIEHTRSLKGVEAYIWAFKRRARNHHCIGYGTFHVDAEHVSGLRKRYSREVKSITMLAILVKAAAIAVERNPEANSILFKRIIGYRIVRFDRADVNVPVTRAIDGKPLTFLVTIRGPAHKRLAAIQDEITNAMRSPVESLPQIQRLQRLDRLPLWIIRLFHWAMTMSPSLYLKTAGTCGLTTLAASWGDHFFPIGPTSAVFSTAGVRSEPVVREGRIAIRPRMGVCLAVDNYVVQGTAGNQLSLDFKELIESGSFVSEELAQSERVADEHQVGS